MPLLLGILMPLLLGILIPLLLGILMLLLLGIIITPLARYTYAPHARYTYAEENLAGLFRCRTSQDFFLLSVSLWNDLADPVFEGVRLSGFKCRANAFSLA